MTESTNNPLTTSIMCVTYNRLELTKRTFESLKKTTAAPYRLICIDNHSTDGTVEYLQSLLPLDEHCVSYDYVLNSENKGIAYGRNQALKKADQYKDPYLATIDNDVEFCDGWLKECVEFLEVNPKFAIGVNFEDVKYPVQEINGKKCQLKRQGNIGTATAVFGRSLFDTIGYFDHDALFLYGHDDALYFWRARLAGFQMAYIETNGVHLGSGDNDKGAYREFKNKYWDQNMPVFHKQSAAYSSGRKSLYVKF